MNFLFSYAQYVNNLYLDLSQYEYEPTFVRKVNKKNQPVYFFFYVNVHKTQDPFIIFSILNKFIGNGDLLTIFIPLLKKCKYWQLSHIHTEGRAK